MYQYDVFLSYKRGGPKEEWVKEIFLPLFQNDLSQNLARNATIFLDTSEIKEGTKWADVLGDSLAKSKCMVAILTPLYFDSQWCVYEFSMMNYRQEKLRQENLLRTNESLLAPFLQQGPTAGFPSYVPQLQLLDYSKYNRVGKGFKDSSDYDELQMKITKDAARVALSVGSAPSWDERFMNPEWISVPFNGEGPASGSQTKQPKPSW